MRQMESVIQGNGKPVGHYTFAISQTDAGLREVRASMEARVKVLFVPVGPWQRDAWYDAEGRLVLLSYEKNGATIRMLLTSDRVETGTIAPVAADPNSVEWTR